jgi:peroxiredoxin
VLPHFTIPAIEKDEHRLYLGLTDAKGFALKDINARLIVLEIFSATCRLCQEQAPNLNKVYQIIAQDPELSEDVKIMAIGAESNSRQIRAFAAQFRVEFPLFPDPKEEIYNTLGMPIIPFTALVTPKGEVLSAHSGKLKDVDGFLQDLREHHKKQKDCGAGA